jgi:hypothetical protein
MLTEDVHERGRPTHCRHIEVVARETTCDEESYFLNVASDARSPAMALKPALFLALADRFICQLT